MAGQYPLAKSRSVALDLRLDGIRHIHAGPVGHVAITPGDMLSRRSAALIEQRGLRHDQVGPVYCLTCGGFPLPACNLFQRAPDMYRTSLGALGGFPGDRLA